MTQLIASIQEGQEADGLRDELAIGLRGIAAESFGGRPEDTDVKWKVIPKGFAWTAGKPSRTSVLICVVPEDLAYKTRARFMRRVNDFWVDETGTSANELLIFTHHATL